MIYLFKLELGGEFCYSKNATSRVEQFKFGFIQNRKKAQRLYPSQRFYRWAFLCLKLWIHALAVFCFRRAEYEDLPNGSIVYLGVMVCGECLEKKVSEGFRELVGAKK